MFRRTLFALTVCLCISCQSAKSTTADSMYRIDGSSMEPLFPSDTFLAIDENAYEMTTPQRGDIVVFNHPRNEGVTLAKRVIGLPGETIEVKDRTVLINGVQLEETYIKEPPFYSLSPTVLGENEFFVLGDNRNNTSDSHTWGALPFELIIGKAISVCEAQSIDTCTAMPEVTYSSSQ